MSKVDIEVDFFGRDAASERDDHGFRWRVKPLIVRCAPRRVKINVFRIRSGANSLLSLLKPECAVSFVADSEEIGIFQDAGWYQLLVFGLAPCGYPPSCGPCLCV